MNSRLWFDLTLASDSFSQCSGTAGSLRISGDLQIMLKSRLPARTSAEMLCIAALLTADGTAST